MNNNVQNGVIGKNFIFLRSNLVNLNCREIGFEIRIRTFITKDVVGYFMVNAIKLTEGSIGYDLKSNRLQLVEFDIG